jgi:hypothetical protein
VVVSDGAGAVVVVVPVEDVVDVVEVVPVAVVPVDVVVVLVGVVDDVLVVVVFEGLPPPDELTLAAANALAPPRARITRAMTSDETRCIPLLSESCEKPQPPRRGRYLTEL